jgi:hypothetical protein
MQSSHFLGGFRPFRRIIGEKQGFGKLPTSKNLSSGSRPETEILRKCGHTSYACSVMTSPERTGTEWKRNEAPKRAIISPKRGNPLQETVCYKLGGTVYEVHTSCGGTEPLYDKMVRLIRSEAIATSADKEDKPQYKKDSNLFVGRSLQEE